VSFKRTVFTKVGKQLEAILGKEETYIQKDYLVYQLVKDKIYESGNKVT
jgi:hypothetical protein